MFMFYARVLTGDYTEMPNTYSRQMFNMNRDRLKAPPIKDPSKNILYDSVVDSVGSPSRYVVFNNDQSYPGYLITCTQRIFFR